MVLVGVVALFGSPPPAPPCLHSLNACSLRLRSLASSASTSSLTLSTSRLIRSSGVVAVGVRSSPKGGKSTSGVRVVGILLASADPKEKDVEVGRRERDLPTVKGWKDPPPLWTPYLKPPPPLTGGGVGKEDGRVTIDGGDLLSSSSSSSSFVDSLTP